MGVALVNHSVFPFLLACGTAALTLISAFCALLSLRGVRVIRATSGDASTGQAVDLPLRIVNRTRRRRQDIVLEERIPFVPGRVIRTVVPPLKAKEDRIVSRRALAMIRGEFELDRVILRSGDPAGLFRRERRFSCPTNVVVYPGVEPVPDLLLNHHETMHSTTATPISAAGMSQDFYGVREYTPTDGLRFIHWRSSARYGRLMVKEFERNATQSVAVLLDANEAFVSGDDEMSNLEYQIRAAASICHHCAGLYCELAFAAGGDRLLVQPPRPAPEVQHDVLYNLAALRPGRVPVTEAAFELARLLPSKTVVFCLSLTVTKAMREALETLTESGLEVRWYCAERDTFRPKKKRKTRSSSERNLEEILVGSLVPVAQLRPDMHLEEALASY
jgi:uncharacterized protein (DUF58 family)